jgi:type II secretory pathway pseudopilin PulG
MSMRGFTIIETFVVVSITAIIFVMGAPITVDFFSSQQLSDQTLNMMTILRRAQVDARTQLNDLDHGVYFTSGSYTLFSGPSYATRTTSYDEVFTVPSEVSTSGISEVVFTKLTGVPSTISTLSVTQGSTTKQISINAMGKIEQE